ncbi:pyrroline-5-carboxylate reductase [Bathymodiolus platifrons methanotrophic gill symbiont]|uniref:pyrroline-5-carboxylate reductase n=1 Tax=Bathymodiolus platifrons methanotrophic gill symbiont TaxID=113268 RepID=UPI000B41EA99|nr:pyrroline-5-carboxylate reductase [Bathymodiolus platifrons methanotrophic gill symbiont]TXK93754.1 pyrroline-5-carboxylate reductase [Methylococcaceae bacterium HT1]TXL12396.1 pyrroline-5-carboxylate reductase [Methylococcaceae bacterium HT4]TXL14539.1 pyrroline-5-carboxylate reductase [Methylococcaceae bacterium HT3]TXL16224.1 pyrroline-5-carboxylate reductase [Methylococcaceae bacterium HT5]TXL22187.1 pyrroline-5-carboxylate reductase [Methylococcaceae bacterium HT2]
MKTKKIGFIGGGNMANSLISGLIASGHSAQQIWVADSDQEKLSSLATSMHINTSATNDALIAEVDVVVLAVKPQAIAAVIKSSIGSFNKANVLLVSIAAGINQASLSKWLGADKAIVRCMPNTPALVQTGATGLHANKNVTEEQHDLAENIMRSVGISVWVENESELDAVTAVSGSGPAYFFLLMEAMEKSALELGLSRHTAQLLIEQTALGAARIALESTESPEELRHRVTSPGGTTEQAIITFEQGGFTELVRNALQAANDRSISLSKELGAE